MSQVPSFPQFVWAEREGYLVAHAKCHNKGCLVHGHPIVMVAEPNGEPWLERKLECPVCRTPEVRFIERPTNAE